MAIAKNGKPRPEPVAIARVGGFAPRKQQPWGHPVRSVGRRRGGSTTWAAESVVVDAGGMINGDRGHRKWNCSGGSSREKPLAPGYSSHGRDVSTAAFCGRTSKDWLEDFLGPHDVPGKPRGGRSREIYHGRAIGLNGYTWSSSTIPSPGSITVPGMPLTIKPPQGIRSTRTRRAGATPTKCAPRTGNRRA